MTEKVTIEGSGSTFEEALSNGLLLDNASSEETLLKVLLEIEKITESMGIVRTAAERNREAQRFNRKEREREDRAWVRSQTTVRQAHEQFIEQWGEGASIIRDNLNGISETRMMDMDSLNRLIDARQREGNIDAVLRLERVKAQVEYRDSLRGISGVHRQMIHALPKSLQGMARGLAAAMSNFTLSPAGVMNFLSNIVPPQWGVWIKFIGGAVIALVATLNHWNRVMFQTAEQGASFNNNLMEMRTAAAMSAMSLNSFAALMKKHSTTFAQYGMTVTQGAKEFSKLSNTILRNFGNELSIQGISMEQVNELLPVFMNTLRAGAQGYGVKENAEAQAASLKRLMVETDLMAKLTGKSRQAIAEEVQKKSNDMAFQNALSKMDRVEREKVMSTMTRMQGQFGDLGGDLVKLRVLGLPPMTEAQRLAAAALGESVNQINKATDAAMSTGVSVIEHQKKLDDASVKAMIAAVEGSKGMEAVIAAGAAGLGGTTEGLAKVFNDMALQGIKFKDKNGVINKEAIQQMYAKARTEQAQQDKVKATLDKFRNAFDLVVAAIFDKVLTPLYNTLEPLMGSIGDILGPAVLAIGDILVSVFSILRPVTFLFKAFWTVLSPGLKVIGGFISLIGYGFKQLNSFVMDFLGVGKFFDDIEKDFSDFTAWFDGIWNSLSITKDLGPFLDILKETLTDVIEILAPVGGFIFDLIMAPTRMLMSGVQIIGSTLISIGTFIYNTLRDAFSTIISGVMWAGQILSSGFRMIVSGVEWYIDAVSNAWNNVVSLIDWAAGAFKDPWATLLSGIDWVATAMTNAWDNVLKGIESIFGAIQSIWGSVKGLLGKFGLSNVFGGNESKPQAPTGAGSAGRALSSGGVSNVVQNNLSVGSQTVLPSSPNVDPWQKEYLDKMNDILSKMSQTKEEESAITESTSTDSSTETSQLRDQLMRIASLMEEQISISRDIKSSNEDIAGLI